MRSPVLAACLLLLLLPTLAAAAAAHRPACLTAAGAPVDWWLALKHPAGDTFSYTDASLGGAWAPSAPGLASRSPARSPLAATLAPLYGGGGGGDAATLAYALWNDEPPPGGGDNATAPLTSAAPPWFAHAKGGLLLSPAGGAWLLHSAPRFPPRPGGGRAAYDGLARPQQVYGQAFLCLALDAAGAAAAVAGLAGGLAPLTFAAADPGGRVGAAFPGFGRLAHSHAGRHAPRPAGLHTVDLSTAGGLPLRLFTSGGGPPPAGLWDAGVARGLLPPPALLAVASWRRGRGTALPPACAAGKPAVLNVLSIRPPGAAAAWSGEDDHGKWGVGWFGGGGAAPGVATASCVGDANREASQLERGGAVVCLVGNGVLGAAVAGVDGCRLVAGA